MKRIVSMLVVLGLMVVLSSVALAANLASDSVNVTFRVAQFAMIEGLDDLVVNLNQPNETWKGPQSFDQFSVMANHPVSVTLNDMFPAASKGDVSYDDSNGDWNDALNFSIQLSTTPDLKGALNQNWANGTQTMPFPQGKSTMYIVAEGDWNLEATDEAWWALEDGDYVATTSITVAAQ